MRKLPSLISVAALALAVADPTSAQPYGPDSGMMGGWGYGYGFGMFHMLIGVIVLVAIIAGVVWLVRTVALSGTHQSVARRSPGLDVLEERYARSEIKRDEYLEKKRDIAG